jgi:hypothetical protein
VEIVDTIDELCQRVDVVMLESGDGRTHLAQARLVIEAGKRLFIDKPVAASLADAMTIFMVARDRHVPVFSSSAYRFYDGLVQLKQTDVGEIKSAVSYGTASIEPHHPDLFWEGVHPSEALFTVLGRGCQTVARTATADIDVVTCLWSGGRVETLHTRHSGATPRSVTVFGSNAFAQQTGTGDAAPLIREVMKFFQTGVAPVAPEETLEIYAFMEAADESKRQGGVPVKISDVIAKARAGK